MEDEEITPKFKEGDIVCLFFDKSKRFLVEEIYIDKSEDNVVKYLVTFFAGGVQPNPIAFRGSRERNYEGFYSILVLPSYGHGSIPKCQILASEYVEERYLMLAPEEK